jgi:hypothetical protein
MLFLNKETLVSFNASCCCGGDGISDGDGGGGDRIVSDSRDNGDCCDNGEWFIKQ